MKAFPLNLRNIMQSRRMTVAALAKQLGVSTVTVGFWRRGKWEPKMAVAIRLARVLGTTVERLAE